MYFQVYSPKATPTHDVLVEFVFDTSVEIILYVFIFFHNHKKCIINKLMFEFNLDSWGTIFFI